MRDEMIFFMDLAASGEMDENGDPKVYEKTSGMVFAEMKSVGMKEFYQAQTAGRKPEIKFVITDYADYQGQEYLIHSDIRYHILRTYRNESNELEITCYGGVRNVSTPVSYESN